jgi:hypothetical protein
MIFKIAMFLHFIGFIGAIGITLVTFLAYKQFWKLYKKDKEQGLAAFRAFKSLQVVGLIGLALILAAGITMLGILNWNLVHLVWFQIKLGLVLLIFVNGFTLGRVTTLKLQDLIAQNEVSIDSMSDIDKLRKQLQSFQVIQLLIFVLIIFLSVFQFA